MENTNQRLEGNKEETLSETEKRQQEDEKLEGDPREAKTSLTGGDQDQDKSWERKKAQQQLVQQLWGVQA